MQIWRVSIAQGWGQSVLFRGRRDVAREAAETAEDTEGRASGSMDEIDVAQSGAVAPATSPVSWILFAP